MHNENGVSDELAKDLLDHFEIEELGDSTEGSVTSNNVPARQNRIVVIVGAGASVPAGLPNGQQLKEVLFDSITNPTRGLMTKQGVEVECEHYLRQAGGQGKTAGVIADDHRSGLTHETSFDLLEFCEALQGYVGVRNAIRDTIRQRLWRPNTRPLLTYELIAHLLNHRFINHVICLNFDTLLDESLRDEMGYDGVDILVSDRDIEEAATFETSRGVDDKPRYLKPHGSISSPDSMRFTLRETSGMFRAMRSLVCRTIFGDDCAAHKPTDVILVMVGWACREQEFKRILGEGKDRIKRVYWLYPKDCEGVMQDHSIRPLGKEINAGKIRSLPFTLPQNGGRGLDGAFLDLFVGVVKQAHERRISLPPIARHLLYCYCFSPTQSEQRQWTEALTDGYPAHPTREDLSRAADRLQFEIFYFSLKTKGAFSTYNMSKVRRIQESLKRFLRLASQFPEEAETLQVRWSKDQDLVASCFMGDLESNGFEDYLYDAPKGVAVCRSLERLLQYFWGKRPRHGPSPPHYLSFEERTGSAVPRSLENTMKEYLSGLGRARSKDRILAHLLARHLETVRCMDETEVSKRPSPRISWLFRCPNTVRSVGDLKRGTEQFLRKTDWDSMQIIAETGEWLLEGIVFEEIQKRSMKKSGIRIDLIVREEEVPLALGAKPAGALPRKFSEGCGNRVALNISQLPWWRHNTHLTVFLGHGQALRGLYFRRRLKTPVICPVWIEDLGDVTRLKEIFKTYQVKTEEWKASKNSRASSALAARA